MLLLVSGATKTVRQYAHSKHLGCLLTPDTGNSLETMAGLPWAADNAAFSGFDEGRFLRMLERIRGQQPIFVTAPDIVGRAAETLELFRKWEPRIREYGLPVALVLQDGQEKLPVPWERTDAFFIGGSTEWKLGKHAYQIVQHAKALGKWIHMGRVNSFRRLEYAREIGCNSVDGTGYSMFPNTHIPKALRFLEQQQLMMFSAWEA
jgi:hypothetical protein